MIRAQRLLADRQRAPKQGFRFPGLGLRRVEEAEVMEWRRHVQMAAAASFS